MTDFPIKNINWPAELSDNLKNKLMAIAQLKKDLKQYPSHIVNGDTPGVSYLIDGIIMIYYTSENMNNIRGIVCGQHDWLGADTIDRNTESTIFIEQVEEVKYLFFPTDKVKKLAETEPEVFKWLYYCFVKMQPSILQNQLISIHDKEIRIVYALLTLAKHKQVLLGQQTSLQISQQQLSTITGLSRPRINEVLKKIEKQNEIVIERGKIHIIDKLALGKRLDHANLMFADPRN